MKKYIYPLLLLLIACFALERFCHHQTQGFRLGNIFSDHLPSVAFEFAPPLHLARVEALLEQPYFFLTSGGESYVFLSQDRKTVLKFFKNHHMRERSWLDRFSLYFRDLRRGKRERLFTSCKIAYEQFPSQTGLLYLQLNPTHRWKSKLTIYDPIGIVHTLDPNTLPFALQKEAALAYPTLTTLMETQEVEAAKVRLSSLVDLIASRCEAGITNHDCRKRNFGFVGAQAIELDLGAFSIDPTLKSESEKRRAFLWEIEKVSEWVKKHHPELSEYLTAKIKKVVDPTPEID